MFKALAGDFFDFIKDLRWAQGEAGSYRHSVKTSGQQRCGEEFLEFELCNIGGEKHVCHGLYFNFNLFFLVLLCLLLVLFLLALSGVLLFLLSGVFLLATYDFFRELTEQSLHGFILEL